MAADGSIIIDTKLDTSGFTGGSEELLRAVRDVSNAVDNLGDNMMRSFGRVIPLLTAIANKQLVVQQVTNTTTDAVDNTTTAIDREGRAVDTTFDKEEHHFNVIDKQVTTTTHHLTGFISKLGTLARISIRAVGRGIAKLASHIKEMATHNRSATLTTQGLIKCLLSLKTMIIGKIKSWFIREITQGLQTALESLRQFSSEYNTSMNNIKNAAMQMSGNIAVSVGNFVTAIEPAITAIIDAVSRAISYLNALFAMLGGKNTVTVAKKQMKDYGAATDSAAGAAEKLNRQVYGFDQLNRRSSNSGGGGGGGAAGGAEDLFEEVPIEALLPEKLQSLFDKMKKAFAEQRWFDLGYTIAEGLNDGLQKVDDWINDTLRPKAVKWSRAIAEGLNGLVEGFDWKLLGKTIADGLNTAADTANTFLKTYNFERLGTRVGEAVNSFFENAEWDLIGETIANKLNAPLDFLYGLGTEINWEKVGLSISEAINSFVRNFKWERIGQNISIWAKGLLDAFSSAVENTDWKTLGEKIRVMLEEIDWKGIWQSTLRAIKAAISAGDDFFEGLLGPIAENLFPGYKLGYDLVDWLKETLGEAFGSRGGGGHSFDNTLYAKTNQTNRRGGRKALVGEQKEVAQAAEVTADTIDKASKQAQDAYEKMHKAAVESLRGQIDLWGDATDKSKVSVDQMIQNIERQRKANEDYLTNYQKITESQVALSAGLLEAISKNDEEARILAATLAEALAQGNMELVQKLSDAYASYDKSSSDLLNAIDGTKKGIVDSFSSLTDLMRTAGANAVNGLIQGIESRKKAAAKVAVDLANDVSKASRLGFQEQSPSKVFKQIGEYLVDGLTIGMEDRKPSALVTTQRLADSVIDRMGGLVTPAIAAGTVVPPRVAVSDDAIVPTELASLTTDMNEYMSDNNYLLRQIIDLLRRINPTIDADSLAAALTSAQRRTVRAYGG